VAGRDNAQNMGEISKPIERGRPPRLLGGEAWGNGGKVFGQKEKSFAKDAGKREPEQKPGDSIVRETKLLSQKRVQMEGFFLFQEKRISWDFRQFAARTNSEGASCRRRAIEGFGVSCEDGGEESRIKGRGSSRCRRKKTQSLIIQQAHPYGAEKKRAYQEVTLQRLSRDEARPFLALPGR